MKLKRAKNVSSFRSSMQVSIRRALKASSTACTPTSRWMAASVFVASAALSAHASHEQAETLHSDAPNAVKSAPAAQPIPSEKVAPGVSENTWTTVPPTAAATAPAEPKAEPAVAAEPAKAPASETAHVAEATAAAPSDEKKTCMATLDHVVRPQSRAHLEAFCERTKHLAECTSTEGIAIQHADSLSADSRGKRILVIGMIHGDEPLAGEMALEWEERLQKIDHRNFWRVMPMLNPDGLKRMTRMNANGVDLNRNFPTKDWKEEAQIFWKKTGKKDPRRFPGEDAASEAETKCVLAQIRDFKPDFIVSIHTPYHVLDFDGPKMPFPSYKDLPWRALGTFPGSLGRYMWKDYQVPVLTIELGTSMVDAARLQDIVGSFAIEATRKAGQKTASATPVPEQEESHKN